MIKHFKEFIYESINIMSNNKLRDSIRNIILNNVKEGDIISLKDICHTLKTIYNINITEDILNTILTDWNKKDYEVFEKGDKSWMEYYTYKKEIKRPYKTNKKIFGKGRDKQDYNYNKGNIHYGRQYDSNLYY